MAQHLLAHLPQLGPTTTSLLLAQTPSIQPIQKSAHILPHLQLFLPSWSSPHPAAAEHRLGRLPGLCLPARSVDIIAPLTTTLRLLRELRSRRSSAVSTFIVMSPASPHSSPLCDVAIKPPLSPSCLCLSCLFHLPLSQFTVHLLPLFLPRRTPPPPSSSPSPPPSSRSHTHKHTTASITASSFLGLTDPPPRSQCRFLSRPFTLAHRRLVLLHPSIVRLDPQPTSSIHADSGSATRSAIDVAIDELLLRCRTSSDPQPSSPPHSDLYSHCLCHHP